LPAVRAFTVWLRTYLPHGYVCGSCIPSTRARWLPRALPPRLRDFCRALPPHTYVLRVVLYGHTPHRYVRLPFLPVLWFILPLPAGSPSLPYHGPVCYLPARLTRYATHAACVHRRAGCRHCLFTVPPVPWFCTAYICHTRLYLCLRALPALPAVWVRTAFWIHYGCHYTHLHRCTALRLRCTHTPHNAFPSSAVAVLYTPARAPLRIRCILRFTVLLQHRFAFSHLYLRITFALLTLRVLFPHATHAPSRCCSAHTLRCALVLPGSSTHRGYTFYRMVACGSRAPRCGCCGYVPPATYCLPSHCPFVTVPPA